MKPDDKPKKSEETFEDPQLFIIIGEESFPKPALETAFVDYSGIDVETKEKLTGCLCNPVMKTVCICNKVRVCSCVGYVQSTRQTSGCQCAPVH